MLNKLVQCHEIFYIGTKLSPVLQLLHTSLVTAECALVCGLNIIIIIRIEIILTIIDTLSRHKLSIGKSTGCTCRHT